MVFFAEHHLSTYLVSNLKDKDKMAKAILLRFFYDWSERALAISFVIAG